MKKPVRRTVTLKDLSRVTHYSINTVSRALRGKDDIAPETVEKIRQTARDMGYINNALASSLRSGRTNSIAVILGDISNPHFAIMMKEIESRARQDGYSSFLLNTNENGEQERAAIEIALNKNVDGIIICPSQQDEGNIRYLMQTNIPFVQIGRRFEKLNAGFVICNDELGGYQATRYLLDKGHRDILMLSGPSYVSSARERQAGYRRAFKEYGLRVQKKLIREVPITSEGCAEVFEGILKEGIHFTAIFAFSDMLAWDAWTCLQRQGCKIPDDYSLIGFDNIQSRFAIPFQLSTISSYKAKMSTTAVACLLCIMRGEQHLHEECDGLCHHVIDTELVEGETVRALSPGP